MTTICSNNSGTMPSISTPAKESTFVPLVANTAALWVSATFLFGPLVGACSAVAHVALSQLNNHENQKAWFPLNQKAVTQVKDYWEHTPHIFKINMIFGLVFRAVGFSLNQAVMEWVRSCMSSPLTAIYAVFRVVIVAPLIEETIFRGFLQEKIRDIQEYIWTKKNVDGSDNKQDWYAHRVTRIALQAMVFGLCHYVPSQGVFNLLIVPLTTFAGYLLGFSKEGFNKEPVSTNLWTGAALHAHINAAVTSRIAVFGV
jgi:membrane protease YdiL (CAAX protease family)